MRRDVLWSQRQPLTPVTRYSVAGISGANAGYSEQRRTEHSLHIDSSMSMSLATAATMMTLAALAGCSQSSPNLGDCVAGKCDDIDQTAALPCINLDEYDLVEAGPVRVLACTVPQAQDVEEDPAIGDPALGRRSLLSGSYMPCGAPTTAVRALVPADRDLPLLVGDDPIFDAPVPLEPGVDPDPDRVGANSTLPYFISATRRPGTFLGIRRPEVASPNCLLCHARWVNGKLVMGLGTTIGSRSAGSMQSIAEAVANLPGQFLMPDEFKTALRTARALAGSDPTWNGMTGADPAAAQLAAERDPETLEWIRTSSFGTTNDFPGTDIPPLWNLSSQSTGFYAGSGWGDERAHMMFQATLCVENPRLAEDVFEEFTDIEAYLKTLEPPEWPEDWPLDSAIAEEGRVLYETQGCKSCHGGPTSDGGWSSPNLNIHLDDIGTDPQLSRHVRNLNSFTGWFMGELIDDSSGKAIDSPPSFYADKGGMMVPTLGYQAKPLRGVWVTAPYLHNGSVPTLRELLTAPEDRPSRWARALDDGSPGDPNELSFDEINSTTYDAGALGYHWIEPDTRVDPSEIMDATVSGYSNTGHRYGIDLSDRERAALLEYLKTL